VKEAESRLEGVEELVFMWDRLATKVEREMGGGNLA
jgi:hypothetical protein